MRYNVLIANEKDNWIITMFDLLPLVRNLNNSYGLSCLCIPHPIQMYLQSYYTVVYCVKFWNGLHFPNTVSVLTLPGHRNQSKRGAMLLLLGHGNNHVWLAQGLVQWSVSHHAVRCERQNVRLEAVSSEIEGHAFHTGKTQEVLS